MSKELEKFSLQELKNLASDLGLSTNPNWGADKMRNIIIANYKVLSQLRDEQNRRLKPFEEAISDIKEY